MKLFPRLRHVLGGMKLRRKLRFAFLAVSLIPVLLLNIFAYLYMRGSVISRAEEGIASGMRQLQIAADDKLRRYGQVLRYAMYDPAVVRFFNDGELSYYDVYENLQEVYLPLLVTIREMNREVEGVGVYTGNPAVKPRGEEILSLAEAGDNAQVQAALKSRKVEWRLEGDLLTGMGMMMRMTRHSPVNVVYLQIPAETLLDYNPGSMERWSLAVTDGQEILFSVSHGGFAAPAPAGAAVTAGRGADGKRLFIVSQEMQEVPWRLQLAFPYDQLHINTRPLIIGSMVMLLISLALIAGTAWLTAESVTFRIRGLNDAMARVEEGTLTEKPEVKPWEKDEIAEMTQHFGNMLDALNRYIEINYKNRITLRDAEMKMLRAQINPHFLYNTLSMINWMAVEHDEAEISEALMQLSQFYRMMLVRGEEETTVRDEAENIMGYLDLQARLHENSFDLETDFPEEIMDCRMIGMVLQPIVENAISHGLDELRDRRGCLKVRGRREGGDLVFTVEDNGPGMSREQFERSLSRESRGYGLKNVNDRLHIAYGPDYGLELASEPGEGTCIRMRIPALPAGEKKPGEEAGLPAPEAAKDRDEVKGEAE